MKILIVTDNLPPLSIGRSAPIEWETAKALATMGHTVSLLTAAKPNAFPAVQDGVRIHTIPLLSARWAHFRSVFSIKRQKEVMRIINAVKPDLIHVHGLAWQIGYRWIRPSVAKGISCMLTAHGVMHLTYGKVTGRERHLWWNTVKRERWRYNPLRNVIVHQALSACSRILCVSDVLRNYHRLHGYPQAVTLRNGLDLSPWKSSLSMQEARRQFGFPHNTPLFLIAGRLGHDKGTNALIAAMPKNAHLIAAGEMHPDAFAALGDRVYQFDTRTAEQMKDLYAACDIAVVPSIYLDPFPTICLEAMACERPVIATVWGGAKESVVEGATGWIVDPLDTKKFSERLQWCADHRAELPAFGMAGRKRMEENFSLHNNHLPALLHIYDEALRS